MDGSTSVFLPRRRSSAICSTTHQKLQLLVLLRFPITVPQVTTGDRRLADHDYVPVVMGRLPPLNTSCAMSNTLIDALPAFDRRIVLLRCYLFAHVALCATDPVVGHELLWLIGMAIFIALMAEGFFAATAALGQHVVLGAFVVMSLVGAIPYIGLISWSEFVATFDVRNDTKPILVACGCLTLGALHHHLRALYVTRGTSNLTVSKLKKTRAKTAYRAVTSCHRALHSGGFLFVFCAVVFFAPEMSGYFLEKLGFEMADPLKAPEHIARSGTTPFYAMLRATFLCSDCPRKVTHRAW